PGWRLPPPAVVPARPEPIDPTVFRSLGAPSVSALTTVVPRLVSAVSAMTDPAALVLDHVEQLENQECLDAVAELALALPTGSRVVLAARHTPPLPVALLRARGRMAEVGAAELAMDQREARALLEAAGVAPSEVELGDLVERAEGWPVGLYLAALARKAGSPRHHAGFGFP